MKYEVQPYQDKFLVCTTGKNRGCLPKQFNTKEEAQEAIKIDKLNKKR